MESSIPLPEYASKLEEHVKQRYLQKISSIGVDPALIVYHQWNQSTFDFTWFWKQASTRNNNLKPSAAYKPIIKWFQGLLRAYKVISLPTSLLFWPKCDTIV